MSVCTPDVCGGCCRYIKATDGQDLTEADVRGMLEGHVSLRHVNVKGHFAFVELQDTPRYASHTTTNNCTCTAGTRADSLSVFRDRRRGSSLFGPPGRITLLLRFMRRGVDLV